MLQILYLRSEYYKVRFCLSLSVFLFYIPTLGQILDAWVTHASWNEVALQAAVLGDRTTRISRHARTSSRGGKKKGFLSRGGFRERTTFAPQGQDGRSERSTGAWCRGRHSTWRWCIRRAHYFQFMFLAIFKSANFRGPPARLSEAPLRYTGCSECSLPFYLGNSSINLQSL